MCRSMLEGPVATNEIKYLFKCHHKDTEQSYNMKVAKK
jgi:hypothetical protein